MAFGIKKVFKKAKKLTNPKTAIKTVYKDLKAPIESGVDTVRKVAAGDYKGALKSKIKGIERTADPTGAIRHDKKSAFNTGKKAAKNPYVAGAAGAVVGFYVGGPAGAAAGAQLAYGASTAYNQNKQAKAAAKDAERFQDQQLYLQEAALREQQAASAKAGRGPAIGASGPVDPGGTFVLGDRGRRKRRRRSGTSSGGAIGGFGLNTLAGLSI